MTTQTSTYKNGRPLTGYKDHAVAPGTVYRPNPTNKIGRSLCGQRVVPDRHKHFDPSARTSCQRCKDSIARMRG